MKNGHLVPTSYIQFHPEQNNNVLGGQMSSPDVEGECRLSFVAVMEGLVSKLPRGKMWL